MFNIRARHTSTGVLGTVVHFLLISEDDVRGVFIADDGDFMFPSLGWLEVIDERFVKGVTDDQDTSDI